jgi:hypothetical protein
MRTWTRMRERGTRHNGGLCSMRTVCVDKSVKENAQGDVRQIKKRQERIGKQSAKKSS